MRDKIKRYFATTRFGLPAACVLLSGISIITLVSVGLYGGIEYNGILGNYKPAVTQLIALGLGLIGMVVISALDMDFILRLWPLHTIACWGLVLLTFVPGIGYSPGNTGSQSWIALPLGMSIQPTELAKLSFCLTFAAHLAHIGRGNIRLRHAPALLLHLGAPVLLLHLQGDDGGAFVFLAMGIGMLLFAGLKRWVVLCGVGAGLASLPLLWHFLLSAHQKQRILGLFNPAAYADGIMYQQLCATEAIRAGGFAGSGLFHPDRVYIPRAENDFIFSYLAEGCGFLGSAAVVILLFWVIARVLRTARQAGGGPGRYICAGIGSALLFQTVVNLGMNLMLLPVMGVTLPFLSAGGTSVLLFYLCIGLVLSVGRGYSEGYLRFLAARNAK